MDARSDIPNIHPSPSFPISHYQALHRLVTIHHQPFTVGISTNLQPVGAPSHRITAQVRSEKRAGRAEGRLAAGCGSCFTRIEGQQMPADVVIRLTCCEALKRVLEFGRRFRDSSPKKT